MLLTLATVPLIRLLALGFLSLQQRGVALEKGNPQLEPRRTPVIRDNFASDRIPNLRVAGRAHQKDLLRWSIHAILLEVSVKVFEPSRNSFSFEDADFMPRNPYGALVERRLRIPLPLWLLPLAIPPLPIVLLMAEARIRLLMVVHLSLLVDAPLIQFLVAAPLMRLLPGRTLM